MFKMSDMISATKASVAALMLFSVRRLQANYAYSPEFLLKKDTLKVKQPQRYWRCHAVVPNSLTRFLGTLMGSESVDLKKKAPVVTSFQIIPLRDIGPFTWIKI